MPKIPTPFTKVKCPICLKLLELSTNRDLLAEHIRAEHRNVPLIPIARSLYHTLNQSVPDNLETIDFDNAATVLANICQDVANKRGLNRLRRQRQNHERGV